MNPSLWDQMMTWVNIYWLQPHMVAVAAGLAIAFGAIWMCAHWPSLRDPRFIGVALAGAFLTMLALIYIQTPIQDRINLAFVGAFDSQTIFDWFLLIGIPSLAISGLVQEGAKMVPMAFWWWRNGKYLTPAMGLAIGAVAGAAFGIYEAFWVFTRVFGAGWTVEFIGELGFLGISAFWERFFAIGFHIAVSALAGWGLAKGKGWQFYLLVSGLHLLFNYPVLFYQKGMLDVPQIETIIAVYTVIVVAAVLWIRWTMDNSGYHIDFLPEEPDIDKGEEEELLPETIAAEDGVGLETEPR